MTPRAAGCATAALRRAARTRVTLVGAFAALRCCFVLRARMLGPSLGALRSAGQRHGAARCKPPSARALVRHRPARPRHLQPRRGGHAPRPRHRAGGGRAVLRRSAALRGRVRRLLRRLDRPHRRPRRRHDHGVSAVRAGHGHRRRARQHVANIVFATAIINLPFYIRLARAEVTCGARCRLRRGGAPGRQRRGAHPGRAPLPEHPAAADGAGLAEHGLGDPERRRPVLHRPGRAAARRRSGASWSPRARTSSSRASGGSRSSPALALMLAVFCFNLLGDGLRDLLDPRRRT